MSTDQSINSSAAVLFGELARLPGYRIGTDGSVWTQRACLKVFTGRWRQLKGGVIPPWGYRFFPLVCEDGKSRNFYAHRLVLEAFVGPCPDGAQACHADGNPDNNRLDNLRWDSPGGNRLDSSRLGTLPRGSRHANAKLDDQAVRAIHALRREGWSLDKLGLRFGVCRETISRIVSGKAWVHVDVEDAAAEAVRQRDSERNTDQPELQNPLEYLSNPTDR